MGPGENVNGELNDEFKGDSNGAMNLVLNGFGEKMSLIDDDQHSNGGDENRKKSVNFSEKPYVNGRRGTNNETRQTDEYEIDFG